mmetsp:Transcript_12819/g.33939  ORF Transcript_12819/g.33939 Transcript_12819/m.33939 type:complete len:248 (-) Transcript_12819:72-815(-)
MQPHERAFLFQTLMGCPAARPLPCPPRNAPASAPWPIPASAPCPISAAAPSAAQRPHALVLDPAGPPAAADASFFLRAPPPPRAAHSSPAAEAGRAAWTPPDVARPNGHEGATGSKGGSAAAAAPIADAIGEAEYHAAGAGSSGMAMAAEGAAPRPSNFCHICTQKARAGSDVWVCANLGVQYAPTCRKMACGKCVERYALGDPGAKRGREDWVCTHCRGVCPEKSQCNTYGRVNKERRVKKVKEEG